jgi:hypothetical protein
MLKQLLQKLKLIANGEFNHLINILIDPYNKDKVGIVLIISKSLLINFFFLTIVFIS